MQVLRIPLVIVHGMLSVINAVLGGVLDPIMEKTPQANARQSMF